MGAQDWTDILLDLAADDQPDWIALEHGDERVTIKELVERARRAARVLSGSSAPVAVSTTSPILHTVGVLGASLAGRAALMVDDAHPDAMLADVVARGGATTTVGRSVAGVDHLGDEELIAGEPLERRSYDPDSIGMILLTSGSTGTPKLVQRSRNADFHFALFHLLGNFPLRQGDRLWICVPHAASPFLNLVLGGLFARATVVFGAFERERVEEFLSTHQISSAFMAPTMLRLARQHSGLEGPGWRNLRALLTGGEKLDPPTAEVLLDKFKGRLFAAYGATEAAATSATSEELAARPGTVGRPAPLRRIRVVTAGTDDDVAVGEEGEVLMSGPDMFTRYMGHEAVGEWYRTGDLGSLDADGYLYITGRASSTVQMGGNRVSTDEVAATLHRHESVAQAAVVAVDDPTWTVRLEGFVVLHQDAHATGEDLRTWLREKLAAYKVPRRIQVLDDMPVNSFGKVSLRALRVRAEQQQ